MEKKDKLKNEIASIENEIDRLRNYNWGNDKKLLQSFEKDLTRLKESSKGIDSENYITSAINDAIQEIMRFLECLEPGANDCTESFDLEKFEKLSSAYADTTIALLQTK